MCNEFRTRLHTLYYYTMRGWVLSITLNRVAMVQHGLQSKLRTQVSGAFEQLSFNPKLQSLHSCSFH